jgi:hypothetical protein
LDDIKSKDLTLRGDPTRLTWQRLYSARASALVDEKDITRLLYTHAGYGDSRLRA